MTTMMKRTGMLLPFLFGFLLPLAGPVQAASVLPKGLAEMSVGTADGAEHRILCIKLPLPDGQEMAFALVPVTTDSNLFAAADISLGQAGDQRSVTVYNYHMRSTPTRLSGSVYYQGCWYILMGQTEVTRGQFAAVMGEPAPEDGTAMLPVTNVTQAQVAQFLEKLNIHLTGNSAAKAVMKVVTPYPLFARLPLEAEWEYSARGATYTLDKKYQQGGGFYENTPYGGSLADYEAFYTSNAVSNKVRPVAGLRPNPCGLYDMLGNAAEIVGDSFRPGYVTGRVGGVLVRGGDVRTRAGDVTSFRRTEFRPCNNGRPFQDSCTGFRVALGSLVVSSTQGSFRKTLVNDWRKHVNPASAEARSTAAKVDGEIFDLSQTLERLNGQIAALPQGGAELESLRSTGNLVAHNLENIQATLARADMESAATGIYMIYISSGYCAHDLRLIRMAEEEIRMAKVTGIASEDADLVIRNAGLNIDGHWQTFCMGCDLLSRSDSPYEGSTTIERGYKQKVEELKAKGLEFQLPRLKAAYDTFLLYRKTGNTPTSELRKAWLEAIGKSLDAEDASAE